MNYLHYDLDLAPEDVVEVALDKQANVRLLDEANYSLYQRGEHHKYYGGRAMRLPVHVRPPQAGHWHLVIDLGGYAGTVTAAVKTIQA